MSDLLKQAALADQAGQYEVADQLFKRYCQVDETSPEGNATPVSSPEELERILREDQDVSYGSDAEGDPSVPGGMNRYTTMDYDESSAWFDITAMLTSEVMEGAEAFPQDMQQGVLSEEGEREVREVLGDWFGSYSDVKIGDVKIYNGKVLVHATFTGEPEYNYDPEGDKADFLYDQSRDY